MAKKSVTNRKASAQVIPGFNAEASIYVSLATYRSSGSSGGRLGAVQPQLGGPNCHRVINASISVVPIVDVSTLISASRRTVLKLISVAHRRVEQA